MDRECSTAPLPELLPFCHLSTLSIALRPIFGELATALNMPVARSLTRLSLRFRLWVLSEAVTDKEALHLEGLEELRPYNARLSSQTFVNDKNELVRRTVRFITSLSSS